jgi:rhamnosyltransferase
MLVQQRAEDVFFSNANAAFRKSLWDRIPFDERLPSCEDQDWARQVVRLGHWVVYEPEAGVYHSHNEWPVQVYRRRAREERGWRHILGKGRGGLRSFLDAWYLSSKADVFHILEIRQKWRWLFLSPLYRFFWALGQWYPYLSR